VTKVLYVEDNDDNVFMLKMRLELLGDFELAAGCNEFDTKPIEFDRLVATLRRVLAHRK